MVRSLLLILTFFQQLLNAFPNTIEFCTADKKCEKINSNYEFSQKIYTSQKKKINNFNKFFKKFNKASQPLQIQKPKTKDNNNFDLKLISTKSIKEKDILITVYQDDLLSSDHLYKQKYMKNPILNEFHSFPEIITKINDNFLQFVVVLIHHLYYYEESNFKEFLEILHLKPNNPVIYMNDNYLLQVFKGTKYIQDIYKKREFLYSKYIKIVNIMEQEWNLQQRQSFLNGRAKIPLQDFLIIYYLASNHGIDLEIMFAFIPGMHLIQTQYQKGEKSRYGDEDQYTFNEVDYHYKYHLTNGDGSYSFLSDKNFEAGQIITKSQRIITDNQLLQEYGYVPDYNPFECIDFQAFTQKQWREYQAHTQILLQKIGFNDTNVLCLSPSKWLQFEVVNDLINIDERTSKQCMYDLKFYNIKMEEFGKNIQFIHEKCLLGQKLLWKSQQIEILMTQLDEYRKSYRELIQRTFKQKQSYPVVEKYFKKKLALLNKIEEKCQKSFDSRYLAYHDKMEKYGQQEEL